MSWGQLGAILDGGNLHGNSETTGSVRVSENKAFRVNDMSSYRQLEEKTFPSLGKVLAITGIALLALASATCLTMGILIGSATLIIIGAFTLGSAVAGYFMLAKIEGEQADYTPRKHAEKFLVVNRDLVYDPELYQHRLNCWKNKFNEEVTEEIRKKCGITNKTWQQPSQGSVANAKFLVKLEEVFEHAKLLSTPVVKERRMFSHPNAWDEESKATGWIYVETVISQKPTAAEIKNARQELKRILEDS